MIHHRQSLHPQKDALAALPLRFRQHRRVVNCDSNLNNPTIAPDAEQCYILVGACGLLSFAFFFAFQFAFRFRSVLANSRENRGRAARKQRHTTALCTAARTASTRAHTHIHTLARRACSVEAVANEGRLRVRACICKCICMQPSIHQREKERDA